MVPRGRILVASPDAQLRSSLTEILRSHEFLNESASNAWQTLNKIESFQPDVVLADDPLPGLRPLDLASKTQLVVMSHRASVDDAVRAVREGAVDYLVKPIDPERLLFAMRTAVAQARAHTRPATEVPAFAPIVTNHPAMRDLLTLIRQIAPSRASVLLEGESGTGKGLFAKAIHQASLRADQPFVPLSCAELTPTLLESEIFGHEKGAFTGAVSRRDGRFQQAHGGTLFLDEVGEIPLGTQVKLLRFMQERSFEPVGGNETVYVDVRILSASNRSLQQAVDDGRFRLDLFYRLNVVSLRIPALRERASDIPLLAGHFLRKFSAENRSKVEAFTDSALDRLLTYPWPGNVRELENVIERAVVLSEDRAIRAHHLPPHVAADGDDSPRIPGATLEQLERWAILQTLESVGGSTARAAAVLGISARKIQYKLREYAEDEST